MKITDITHRRNLPKFLNHHNLCGVGAEIGVFKGEFSNRLLEKWTGTLLYSIDSWDPALTPKQARFYPLAKETLQQHGDRSIILKMTSLEASKIIEDNSLDFCYIDAAHSYEHVSQDCNLWWPKIKPNGVLCGHDYGGDPERWKSIGKPFPFTGVKRAVDEFINSNNLDLHDDVKQGKSISSWYTIKNA